MYAYLFLTGLLQVINILVTNTDYLSYKSYFPVCSEIIKNILCNKISLAFFMGTE